MKGKLQQSMKELLIGTLCWGSWQRLLLDALS